MTREEAIKIVRENMHLSYDKGNIFEALETLIPELAESEDEKIINQIISLIKEVQEDEDWHVGKWSDDAIEWLEKQKGFLHVSETYKENADSFTDKDERIRKTLVKYFKRFNQEDMWNSEVSLKDIVAYLEKQKEEPKPAEWSEEDEENFKWFDKFFRAESVVLGGRDIPQDKYLWFKSLHPQPKQEWSEEDEKMRDRIIDILNRTFSVYSALGTSSTRPSCPTYKDEIAWLKSLRPSWRPSEEQMNALLGAEGILRSLQYDDRAKILASIYEQLKKLM